MNPVTHSGDTRPHILPAPVAEHRVDYWAWVKNHADTAMRDTLIELRDHWQDCNHRFFNDRMHLPYITLTEPSAPVIYGQCCSVSSWGSRLEIRLRPSLLDGTHPHMNGSRAGRVQFVKDVLLHEMIHQHIMEHQPDVNEESYHGHGPVFTEHCNRIGRELGLADVVVRNRGGKKVPKAPQWPHCVAPPDRYLGAYQPHHRVTAKSVSIPAGYTVSAITPVDGTPLLHIDFDTDSGGKPTIRIGIHADTAWQLADFILGYLDGDDDEHVAGGLLRHSEHIVGVRRLGTYGLLVITGDESFAECFVCMRSARQPGSYRCDECEKAWQAKQLEKTEQ